MPRSTLARPLVDRLSPYVPGEQPRTPGLVKLNTNENPYPPTSKVLRTVRQAVDGRLRLYPDPTASELRRRLARLHRCRPENVFVGNGSDEVLTLAVRAFSEPAGAPEAAGRPGASLVQFFKPSYSLYPVLAAIHGAEARAAALRADYSLPSLAELPRLGWSTDAALTLITTPNAPSGRGYATSELAALCRFLKGVVLLDEAYADFAKEHAMPLALEHANVLVVRTFSKAYSLCFQRIGYAVGHPDLIGALDKIKDSYNVNGLGQAAALATLENLPYYRRNFRRIIATRERLRRELLGQGFETLPSQTNFLLCRPPGPPAREWLTRLRKRKILVRWFSAPELTEWLRITVGTDAEADALLEAVCSILRPGRGRKR